MNEHWFKVILSTHLIHNHDFFYNFNNRWTKVVKIAFLKIQIWTLHLEKKNLLLRVTRKIKTLSTNTEDIFTA